MADLTGVEAAQSVKIMGSESDGTEQTPVSSNSNGKLLSADISNNGGVHGVLTVGTSAVEAKVGGSVLSDRVNLTAYNDSNIIIYWGYDNTVTTSTGTPIHKKQMISWEVGPNTSVYLIAGSASNNTRITENA